MDIEIQKSWADTRSFIDRERRVAASLRETLAVLNSNRPLDEVLLFIVHQAREVLSAQGVAIYCPTGQKWLMKIQAQEGLSEDYIQRAQIPLGSMATGAAALRRQPVSIPDVRGASEQTEFSLTAEDQALLNLLSQNYQALLAVPMIFPRGEVYGTLNLYYQAPKNFTEEDIALARAYSDQATLAIDNARLSKRVEQAAILSERERMARDLHDTVTQTLCSVALIADVLPTLWEQDEKNGRAALEELRQLSRGALSEMRLLLFELRPAALLSADIFILVEHLVNAFNSRTRIPICFDRTRFDCRMPDEVRIMLYRMIQELLNNIEKHSHATQVNIVIDRAAPSPSQQRSSQHCRDCEQCVRIVVEDNGVGFNVEDISSDHMGLWIIRERADSIGAGVKIESAPGQGTRVEVIW